MNQDIAGISNNFNQKINPEQFDQIVEAILPESIPGHVF